MPLLINALKVKKKQLITCQPILNPFSQCMLFQKIDLFSITRMKLQNGSQDDQKICVNENISDSEEIRTLASEENGALNHRLRPLGHTTCYSEHKSSYVYDFSSYSILHLILPTFIHLSPKIVSLFVPPVMIKNDALLPIASCTRSKSELPCSPLCSLCCSFFGRGLKVCFHLMQKYIAQNEMPNKNRRIRDLNP